MEPDCATKNDAPETIFSAAELLAEQMEKQASKARDQLKQAGSWVTDKYEVLFGMLVVCTVPCLVPY